MSDSELKCPYNACKLRCGSKENHKAKYGFMNTDRKLKKVLSFVKQSSLVDYEKLKEFLRSEEMV